jgi:hypothetical protein
MRLASVLTVVSTAFARRKNSNSDRILDQTHITDDGIYDCANKVAVRQRARDQVEVIDRRRDGQIKSCDRRRKHGCDVRRDYTSEGVDDVDGASNGDSPAVEGQE